jgi:hypothetical protein
LGIVSFLLCARVGIEVPFHLLDLVGKLAATSVLLRLDCWRRASR